MLRDIALLFIPLTLLFTLQSQPCKLILLLFDRCLRLLKVDAHVGNFLAVSNSDFIHALVELIIILLDVIKLCFQLFDATLLFLRLGSVSKVQLVDLVQELLLN